MQSMRIPKSLRKFVRSEKARIRREASDTQKQKKQIDELYTQIIQRTQRKVKKLEQPLVLKVDPDVEAKKAK